jgi:NDP-sugar pyrophosphorylase family protein
MSQQAPSRVHGIVLAGAYPDGQCALDQLAPRPLLPVAQQPLITYALRWMRDGGLRCVTICANSAVRAVRDGVDRSPDGLQLDYLEDWSPRGAAGCVRDAGLRTDALTFLVADGTTVPVVDVHELLDAHRAAEAAITVVVGADSAGRLRPTGVYVFDRWAFQFIPEEGFYDIKEKLIPRLYAAGETVSTHMAREMAPRVVSADSYLALNQWAIERARDHVSSADGFRVAGEAFVHESARVDPSARLLGPVLVGPRASIGAGATLIGPVSIGQETTVGEGAVVSRSVVWDGCRVGSGAFVDRSMLADGSRVETRRLVVSAVRADDQRTPAAGIPSARSGRALWAPLVAALRPATTNRS